LLPPQNVLSHAFALNGNNANPKVVGVAGLLAAYAQAIQTVTLHGPTNFAPIITIGNLLNFNLKRKRLVVTERLKPMHHRRYPTFPLTLSFSVAQQCHANTASNPFLYTVLLIVTDGSLARTKRRLLAQNNEKNR
jgi:hypothetical protein